METNMNKTVRGDIFKIDPRNIVVKDGFNARVNFNLDELIDSIKENGVLNAVTVVAFKDEDGNEKYRLVDGERRYRACMALVNSEFAECVTRIPAVKVNNLDEKSLVLQQIVRNQGQPFNEYEYGIACQKLLDFGMTKADIARKLGKNAGQISYYIQHLNRDKRIQDLIKNNTISGSEVRRIYASHKNKDGEIDERGAVNEILKALNEKRADADGKKKITTKDMDGKTRSAKNSDIIRKALDILFGLIKETTNNGEYTIDLDLVDIHTRLSDGEDIKDILKSAIVNENDKNIAV